MLLLRHWPNDCLSDIWTLFVRHLKFAYQATFQRLATSKTLLNKYKTLAKRSNNVCQTFEICLLIIVWTFGYVTRHCSRNISPGQTIRHCLANIRNLLIKQCLNAWPRHKILFDNHTALAKRSNISIEHLKFAYKAKFERLVTSQNTAW